MPSLRNTGGPGPASDLSMFTREASSYREFRAAHHWDTRWPTVWTDMPEPQWDHYAEDPRGRRMLVIHDHGDAVGTAMLTMADVLSPDGVHRVPMLEGFTSANPTPEMLRSVFAFAAQHAEPRATIIASNLSYIDSQMLKASGIRTLPSTFNSYLFLKRDPDTIEGAGSLSLEVI
jgi:hypothetical protein